MKLNKILYSLALVLIFLLEPSINQNVKGRKHDIIKCKSDFDCNKMNLCQNGLCKHKDYFPPTSEELMGAILIFIGSALSNAGGTGGGGLLMPILIIFLNFNTKEAIPISKLMILTGSLTALLMGFRNKHPFRDAISIDYNLVILILPTVIFGTMIGVTLNKILSPVLILVILTITMIINTFKTLKKAFQIHQEEMVEASWSSKFFELERKSKSRSSNVSDEYTGLNTRETTIDEELALNLAAKEKEKLKMETQSKMSLESFNSITRKRLLLIESDKDKVYFPLKKSLFCFLCYTTMLLITFLKGSSHVKSILGIQVCSFIYWLIYFLYLPITVLLTIYSSKVVLEEYKYRKEIGYPYHESDIKWNKKLLVNYPIRASLAGVLSGMLGVGGGLILGPFLLDIGIHPMVSTATSNFLVVFISLSTTSQYLIQGSLNMHYGIVCTFFSVLGSLTGTYLIFKIVQQTRKNSILIFILGFVMVISSISIPYHTFGGISEISKENYYGLLEFKSPC